MRELNFNSGYKEYDVNGGATIRVNTTDFTLLDKLYRVKDNIAQTVAGLEQLKQSADLGAILAAMHDADVKVKQELNRVFGSDVSAAAFGDLNCLSFAGGQPIALNFLEAILPEIKADLTAEHAAAEEKIAAYTAAAQQFS